MKLLRTIQAFPRSTAVISGLMFAACYPPSPLGFLSGLVWVPMFLLLSGRTPKQVFGLFFIYGFTATAGTLYWVANVIAPGLWHIIVSGLVLLCGYFALYFAAAGLWASYLYKKGEKILVFFAPFWVLLEYIRSLGEISFPWCTIGYTWGNYLPLIQGLSVTGVYGYSLLILGINVAVYLIIKNGLLDRFSLWFGVCITLCVAVLGVSGFHILSKPDQSLTKIRVSMIQPNINQLVKWDENFLDSVWTVHYNMTRKSCGDTLPELVVWSETALPMYIKKRPFYMKKVRNLFDSLEVPVLFGSLDYERTDEKYKDFNFYNCAFWYRPGMDDFERYEKIRLVPFSEHLPFSGLFPIVNRVDLGEADFSPGSKQKNFTIKQVKFAPSICYEIIYPDFVRNMISGGAGLLVNITNDGWFGRSSSPYQHLNMAKFRCIENRIWLARCANTGISAIVDTRGRIIKKTGIMKPVILSGDVGVVNHRPAFYTRYGDWVVLLCLLNIMGFIAWSVAAGYRKPSSGAS